MIRIVGFGSGMKGLEIDGLDEEEIENIQEYVDSGEPVVICGGLDDLERLDIDLSCVEML